MSELPKKLHAHGKGLGGRLGSPKESHRDTLVSSSERWQPAKPPRCPALNPSTRRPAWEGWKRWNPGEPGGAWGGPGHSGRSRGPWAVSPPLPRGSTPGSAPLGPAPLPPYPLWWAGSGTRRPESPVSCRRAAGPRGRHGRGTRARPRSWRSAGPGQRSPGRPGPSPLPPSLPPAELPPGPVPRREVIAARRPRDRPQGAPDHERAGVGLRWGGEARTGAEQGGGAGARAGARVLWAAAEGAAGVSVRQRRLRRDPTAFYSCLKGGCGQVGIGLSSQVTSDRAGGHGPKCVRGCSGWTSGGMCPQKGWLDTALGCNGWRGEVTIPGGV